MAEAQFFSDEEYAARLARVREWMAGERLAALLVTTPENIFYLTGLDHQGFFAYHLLVVPIEGEMVLITRAMERVTVAAQVTRARWVGYGDNEDPAAVTRETLRAAGLEQARVAIEKDSLVFPPRIYENIVGGLQHVQWFDGSHVIDELRLVKSPQELAYTREAAAVSDAMMRAAIETAAAGVNEQAIAAEVHRAMILGGGGNPGFGPFIRETDRLGQEHTTWRDNVLEKGDALFLEMSACVKRYHAPLGRLVFVGEKPAGADAIAAVCLEAFQRVIETLQPGVTAADVYRAWQARVDKAGLAEYRRHHCGYVIGLGFPPSWSGGSRVVGLREGSALVMRTGMVFHVMSWLMNTGRGDYFISNTAFLGENGCEVLTATPMEVQVV